MALTDYEQLAKIREAWPDFVRTVEDRAGAYPGASVVLSSKRSVPACDPVALHDDELVIIAVASTTNRSSSRTSSTRAAT